MQCVDVGDWLKRCMLYDVAMLNLELNAKLNKMSKKLVYKELRSLNLNILDATAYDKINGGDY